MKFDTTEFDNYFELWKEFITFDLNPNYSQDVYNIRSGMQKRIVIQPLDMITYKKAILYELGTEKITMEINPTEEELELNRFLDGPYKGRKITKVLTEIATLNGANYYKNDQRLDFFHKLRNEEDEYYIDSDPLTFIKLYKEIQTCLSPNGENQSSIIKLLASPNVFIASNKKQTARMLIYADFKAKVVFLHGVYGVYDYMFPLSIVKYFVDNHFTFSEELDDLFYESFLRYKDTETCEFLPNIRFLNGEIGAFVPLKDKVDLWIKPEWFKPNYDVISGFNMTYNTLTSWDIHDSEYGNVILSPGNEFCMECGEIVDGNDFDFDREICNHCSERSHWCESCGDFVDDDHFIEETGECDYCTTKHFVKCPECGNYVANNNYDDANHMCMDCVDEKLIYCEKCQEYVKHDEYDIDSDMCIYCKEEEEGVKKCRLD